MWKKWKESDFCRKLKAVRVNRAVYLSAIVILLSLSVVLVITTISNRAKKNDTPLNENTGDAVTTPSSPTETEKKDTPTAVPDAVPELALPVSGTLSKKHSVDIQVFSNTLKEYRVHYGIDLVTEANAPVCAAADGTVTQIWEDPMMGWCVALTHSGNCVTVYKNLAKDMAEGLATGNEVKAGQLLGYVGDSALMEIADEAHLHMEMTVNGLQVDPLEYFGKAVLASIEKDESFEQVPTGNGK